MMTPRMMNSTHGMATLFPKARYRAEVRGAGEIRPPIRKPLEAFTTQRSLYVYLLLRRSCSCGLMDQVCRVLVLARTLCGCHITGRKLVCSLPGKYRMVIRGGQGVGDVLLIADPVAAVLGLAVNGIAGDAESLRWILFH